MIQNKCVIMKALSALPLSILSAPISLECGLASHILN